jgi:O-antigen/teichoic acid export membrane protein
MTTPSNPGSRRGSRFASPTTPIETIILGDDASGLARMRSDTGVTDGHANDGHPNDGHPNDGHPNDGHTSEADGLAPIQSETRLAAKNSAALGGSLLFTSALGVIVSLFVIPKVLTETSVGILASAEGFASIALVVAGFGMDSYLRKEISVRREHASDFFSALLIVRVLLTVVLTAVAIGVLVLRDNHLGRSTETAMVIMVLFCVAQFFMQTSESFAAMLQAVGEVKVQSRFSILSKVAWAAMVAAGLAMGFGLWLVPTALIITELAKTIVFGIGAQRTINISWTPRFGQLPTVLKAAAPFLVTALSVKLIQFLDVSMIRFLTGSDRETGFYSQALKLSGVALLLAPIVQWVALPMAARAVERSRNEFANLVKRSYELVLCAGIPLSLLLTLNADLAFTVLLPRYAPAIPALRILSVLIVLSYVSMLGGTLLIADGRGWRVVRITFLTIGIDFVMNLYLIRHGWQWFGEGTLGVKDGGAGTGAAISLVTAELVGSSLYIYELRRVVRRVSDPASRRRVARTLLACAITAVLDRVFVPLWLARPFLDTAVLVAALRVFGVIEPTWFGLGFAAARKSFARNKA